MPLAPQLHFAGARAACRRRHDGPRAGTVARAGLDVRGVSARWCWTRPTGCSTWASKPLPRGSSARRRRIGNAPVLGDYSPTPIREKSDAGRSAPRSRSGGRGRPTSRDRASCSSRSTSARSPRRSPACCSNATRSPRWCLRHAIATPMTWRLVVRPCPAFGDRTARRHGATGSRRSARAVRQPQLHRAWSPGGRAALGLDIDDLAAVINLRAAQQPGHVRVRRISRSPRPSRTPGELVAGQRHARCRALQLNRAAGTPLR